MTSAVLDSGSKVAIRVSSSPTKSSSSDLFSEIDVAEIEIGLIYLNPSHPVVFLYLLIDSSGTYRGESDNPSNAVISALAGFSARDITSVNLVFRKAVYPILVTEFGIVSEPVKPLQPANADCTILVTE